MIHDKLFLLSEEEFLKYLPNEADRQCKCKGEVCCYWLRSESETKGDWLYIDIDGTLAWRGLDGHILCGVRPALHLNTDYLHLLKRNKEKYIRFGGIKWLVLDEKSGLLLAKKAVDMCQFFCDNINYDEFFDVSYIDSKIRAYLNDNLYFRLFMDEEKKMIMDTVIVGEESYPFT